MFSLGGGCSCRGGVRGPPDGSRLPEVAPAPESPPRRPCLPPPPPIPCCPPRSMQRFWSVILPFTFASPVGIFLGYIVSDLARGVGAASISALASGGGRGRGRGRCVCAHGHVAEGGGGGGGGI